MINVLQPHNGAPDSAVIALKCVLFLPQNAFQLSTVASVTVREWGTHGEPGARD